MKNSLLLYLNDRMGKSNASPLLNNTLHYAPIITISREVGCRGLVIAKKLANQLNEKAKPQRWRVFSKEIFEEAAKELEMHHLKIQKILHTEGRNSFDEILGALADKRFKSEKRIQKAVIDTVKCIAADGYCILVGRGAHIIAQDADRALHIRFYAPLPWRIKKIKKRHQLNDKEALQYINSMEKERENFRKNICPKNMEEPSFDLEINVAAFSSQSIIELIETAIKVKTEK